MNKTKVMCLSKSQSDKIQIECNNCKLEQVERYTYLGFELTSNFSYKVMESSLMEKARKATFKLRSLLYDSYLKPKLCLQLFDQLIKPICLYGSEIWGQNVIKTSNSSNFNESLAKFESEKLNISFAKFILGVHKKAQNSAVRGELGRLPLGIDIVANILTYYYNISLKTKSSILTEAFELYNSNNNKSSWVFKSQQIINYIKKNCHEVDILKRKSIIRYCKDMYIQFWKKKITSESKMRTYILYKNNFCYEKYLDILATELRKPLTQFRISAHNLEIERGRYTRPVTPVNQRICRRCNASTDSELHFLFECGLFTSQREQLFINLTENCPLFTTLSDENKLQYLLNSEGSALTEIAVFLKKFLP